MSSVDLDGSGVWSQVLCRVLVTVLDNKDHG